MIHKAKKEKQQTKFANNNQIQYYNNDNNYGQQHQPKTQIYSYKNQNDFNEERNEQEKYKNDCTPNYNNHDNYINNNEQYLHNNNDYIQNNKFNNQIKNKYVSSPLNVDKEAIPQQNNYEQDNSANIQEINELQCSNNIPKHEITNFNNKESNDSLFNNITQKQ